MNLASQDNSKNRRLVSRKLGLIAFLFIFGVECAKNQTLVAAGATAGRVRRQTAVLSLGAVVFNSNRTGNDEIYVMNADGSGPRQLRAAGADGWKIQGHAEWSPNGKHLAMFGGKDWKSSHVYVTDSEGRNPRRLTSRKNAHYVDPSRSPDGRTIVFTGCPARRCGPKDLEVFTLHVSGSQPEKQLTSDSIPDYDPYYSPDGKLIGWTSRVADTGEHGVWNIRLANADGSGVRFVTNDGNVNGYPAWSRDGKLIYFHRMVYGENPNFGIYVIRPDGQEMKVIAAAEEGNDEYRAT